jgi:hypothetical protein
MLVLNEFSSLFLMDLVVNLSTKLLEFFRHKPKHLIIGHATAVLRQWKQYTEVYKVEDKRYREWELTAPELPILSVVVTDLQADQYAFPWHRVRLKSLNRLYGFKVYQDQNIIIRYVPYLYTIRLTFVFTGRSFAETTEAKFIISEFFDTNQMTEFEMSSLLIIPPETLESMLTPEQLDILDDYVPKELVKLINEERYVIPFQFLVRKQRSLVLLPDSFPALA